jgi:hypothetical protein
MKNIPRYCKYCDKPIKSRDKRKKFCNNTCSREQRKFYWGKYLKKFEDDSFMEIMELLRDIHN